MDTKTFVEDSFTLTPKDILRNAEGPRKIGTPVDNRRHDINYWLDYTGDEPVVLITIGTNEPQRFKLEWDEITFGEKAYFRCTCERRATKLYLPPNGTQFKCRICHRLLYQLSTLNRRSVAGKSIYRLNRLHKLANSRASMGRILYKGNFTKRFERFLGLCERAGYDTIVKGAEDLKAFINNENFVEHR